MKRVLCFILVICFFVVLSAPVVLAASLDFTDLEVLLLEDYYIGQENVADLVVREYKFSQDDFGFQFNNVYSLVSGNNYSFQNVTGKDVLLNGFNVSYCDVPSNLSPYTAFYNGNEIFDASSIPGGSYVTFDFPFSFCSDYSDLQYGVLVSVISFYDAEGNGITKAVSSYNVSDSSRNLSYIDRATSLIQDKWEPGSYSGIYSVGFSFPDNVSYFTIGFRFDLGYAYKDCSYSFSFGDCTMKVEGLPYPTQPTISYNWSDTGAATYPLGTTTGSPLQVNVTNPQSYGTYSYQWYSGQFNKYDSDHLYGYGSAIEGATSAVYMPPVDHLGTYWYYCIVGHESGDNMAYTHTSDCLVTVVDPASGGSGVDPTDPSDPSGGGSGTDSGGDSTDTTDPSDPSGGGSGGDTGGDSGDNNTEPTVSNDDIAAGIEQSNNLLENIVNGILNLPQTIMDGIKGLFVPDAEAMAAYKDQWEALLSQRFGAIYESVQLIDDFASSLSLQGLQGTVTFPSVELDLAGTPFVFGGWEVDVVPDGFEFLIEVLKKIISIVATLAFINAMRNKFEGILGGSS